MRRARTGGTGRAGVVACGRSAGYTLVELLVVMVVLGILLGLVSLSIVPDPSARLRRDAERLEALFALAAEEAQLSSQPIAWRGDRDGYAFYRQGRDGWTVISNDAEFRARRWDITPVRVTVDASDVPRWRVGQSGHDGLNDALEGSSTLAFPRDGLQPAFDLRLEAEGRTVVLRSDGGGGYRVESGA